MAQTKRVQALNLPGMARARALIKAVGYDSEDLRPVTHTLGPYRRR
jgi:hypothetical protein